MLSLIPLIAVTPALAQDDTTVFVSEFQAVSDDAASLAALLSMYLLSELDSEDGIEGIPVHRAPDFGEHSALVYLMSCPPGQYVGCAWVVGNSVQADYTVAGTVASHSDGGASVELVIIDVAGSREAYAFDYEIPVGEDQAFATEVSDILLGVIAGDIGAEEDIRVIVVPSDPDEVKASNDENAEDIQTLSKELDEVSEQAAKGDKREVEKSEYTLDDLAGEMDTDAATPWEVVGLSAEEYLRYKNSGLSLQGWRDLAAGRRFQLIVRGAGAVGRGPWSTAYRGWYAEDSSTLVVIEQQAWQARETSTSVGGLAWVGFGVSPVVEVSVGGGVATGAYTMHIQKETVGQPVVERPGVEFSSVDFLIGGRVLGVPFPTSRVRPIVGVGAIYAIGEGNDQNLRPATSTGLPTFPGNNLVFASGWLGGEVTVNDWLDIYGMAPLSFLVAGTTVQDYTNGTPGNITTMVGPDEPSPIAAGVELGISLRFLGKSGSSSDSRIEYP